MNPFYFLAGFLIVAFGVAFVVPTTAEVVAIGCLAVSLLVFFLGEE